MTRHFASPYAIDGDPSVDRLVIELNEVTKMRESEQVLGPLDLRIRERERIALVGPSGSGKSTLLRLIVGLLEPDRGRVAIFGRPMQARTAAGLRLQMGYVIQEGGLFPHWTGGENAAVVARELGWDRARIARRTGELRELVGLDAAVLDRYPVQLSGGERQRVALMRALFLDPSLLVFDEPLGALDPLVRFRLEADLKRIFHDLDKTVVWVTHDLEQAAFLAEELLLLRKGKIEQRGRAEDLASHPATSFVREFVAAARPHGENGWRS